jgi:hypothetical protein
MYSLKTALTIWPAIVVLLLTFAISLLTGHPPDLFFAGSRTEMLVRFTYVTTCLLAPIVLLPWTLTLGGKAVKKFGQPVSDPESARIELTMCSMWIVRPIQGIALSMILAERFLDIVGYSTGPLSQTFVRLTFFTAGGILTSLFLSTVWSLDDLGVKIYNSKSGEIRTVGGSVGIIFPLLGAAIGISSIFHYVSLTDAVIKLMQIFIVLYPSYVIFATAHNEFFKKRLGLLSRKVHPTRIEINIT